MRQNIQIACENIFVSCFYVNVLSSFPAPYVSPNKECSELELHIDCRRYVVQVGKAINTVQETSKFLNNKILGLE